MHTGHAPRRSQLTLLSGQAPARPGPAPPRGLSIRLDFLGCRRRGIGSVRAWAVGARPLRVEVRPRRSLRPGRRRLLNAVPRMDRGAYRLPFADWWWRQRLLSQRPYPQAGVWPGQAAAGMNTRIGQGHFRSLSRPAPLPRLRSASTRAARFPATAPRCLRARRGGPAVRSGQVRARRRTDSRPDDVGSRA